MKALRWATCALGLALLGGCGVASPPEGRSRAAIVGGTPTAGDLDVFLLSLQANNGRGTLCSATLIAPRTLLTAAHCLDPSMLGGTSLTIFAANVPTEAEVRPGVNTVQVVETRLHPSWNPAAGLAGDLALALLAAPPAIAPKPWNALPLEGLGGQAVRAVGYGASGPDAGLGTKRTVDLSIRQLTAELISLGNFVDRGICHGDSGGPSFHTFGDGVERLVGVHSFTRTEDCLDGADTRVDANAPFLLQWLAEKEDACGPNLVCAVSGCPAPDPDCVPLGEACQTVFQCQGRRCVDDPQHPAPYCSQACSTDGDCGGDRTCDVARGVCQRAQLPPARRGEACTPGESFCLGDTRCTGAAAGDQPRCLARCAQTATCLLGQTCLPGLTGENVCVDAPPVQLPLAELTGPAAGGCATLPALWPMVAAGLLLLRKRP